MHIEQHGTKNLELVSTSGISVILDTKAYRLLDFLPVMISHFLPDGTLVFVNRMCCEVLNVKKDEVVGLNFLNFVPNDKRNELKKSLGKLSKTNSRNTLVHQVNRPDGNVCLMEWVNQALFDTSGEVAAFLAFGKDISEEHSVKEALQCSRDNLNEAQRIAQIGSWQWDIKSNISVCSDGLFSLFGLEEQSQGFSFEQVLQYIHPDDKDLFVQRLEETLTERKNYENIYRIIRSDGEVRVHRASAELSSDDDGQPKILTGTQQDITEQYTLESLLKKRNSELEFHYLLQQQLIQAKGVKDSMEVALKQILKLLNAEVGGIFQVLEKTNELKFIGQYGIETSLTQKIGTLSTVRPGITMEALQENKVVVVNTSSHPYQEYVPFLEKMGIKTSASIPFSAKGKVLGIVTVGLREEKSLTENELALLKVGGETAGMYIENARMYEKIEILAENLEQKVTDRTGELLETQEELKQSLKEVNKAKAYAERKAAELESFSYSISHDLKAPLRGIEGYSGLLEDEYSGQLDDDGVFFLKSVRKSALQMNSLIDDLLKYSRLDRMDLNTEQVDIAKLLENLINLNIFEPGKPEPRIEFDLQVTEITSEPSALHHVFENLIGNAIKFSRDCKEKTIFVESWKEGREYIFRVVDQGVGFDMRYHDRIFEIFQRLEKSEDFPGTGVGLAIVKKIVTRLGGRVWADSIPQEGSSFYVAIPEAA